MIIETQTPNIYIKNQSLSAEVEEWLKTHKATVLPSFKSTQTGYTRDYTPNANKPKKEDYTPPDIVTGKQIGRAHV